MTDTVYLAEPATAAVADPEPPAGPTTTEAPVEKAEPPAVETPAPVAPAAPPAVTAA
jgi:hypothetical protein